MKTKDLDILTEAIKELIPSREGENTPFLTKAKDALIRGLISKEEYRMVLDHNYSVLVKMYQ